MPRVIAICLDGYEHSLALAMMGDGELPAMRALAERSARFVLDHGADLRTGLAGEHVATGLSAADAGRWAAVHFDRQTYEVWQQGTSLTPFPAAYSLRTVVLDPPYFDLAKAPNVRGFVAWGAHDPGVAPFARPHTLLSEIAERFGPYPAQEWIYGTPWSSVEASQAMGDRLTAAVRLRTRISTWLLEERLPDWDLALLTISEAHSAIEGLWHGVDAGHPLNGVASSAAARTGVRGVYAAIDEQLAALGAKFPDAALVVFSMHGMGANGSDPASMFLLGELLYRHAFGKPLHENRSAERLPGGQPALGEGQNWRNAVRAGFPRDRRAGRISRGIAKVSSLFRARAPRSRERARSSDGPARMGLDWMPATAYCPDWPAMPAFALPSFYDGRVRINLRGREAHGIVELEDYSKVLEDIATLLAQCTDSLTGRPVVKSIERAPQADPRALGETEADLVIVWEGAPLGFSHPALGTIGPVPYRRTGGHTGAHGFAYFATPGVRPADRGATSSYDVVPSILSLLGERAAGLSGTSVFGQAALRKAAT
jgi:predicted AlkP superfamily phosphohydrolase/phosphomutase